jgi:glutamate-1-semialdehyde 2,1-aminomutase
VTAVIEAAKRGTSFGAPTEAETELAAEVVARVAAAEMVRLTSSGTEAAMTAIRLARSATGRDKVVKFAGSYHGHVDGLLADAGSGLATQGIPASPGVTPAQAADTLVVRWNDREQLERTLDVAGATVACVIAEAVPANMGVVPPQEDFLELLRALCDEHGALLVLDEVITGFRVAYGGAQERYGVEADLSVLGKVLGGGLPLAAVTGRRAWMELLAPVGSTYQAGTLSGNPLATAAGLATLRLLGRQEYERLSSFSERLARGLREEAREVGAAVEVVALCGLLTVFFSERPVRSWDEASVVDAEAYGRFFRAMLERGVYLPPSPFEAWFPSLAHGEQELERTIVAARESFEAALR